VSPGKAASDALKTDANGRSFVPGESSLPLMLTKYSPAKTATEITIKKKMSFSFSIRFSGSYGFNLKFQITRNRMGSDLLSIGI
jgi:hypothetical protein